MTSAKKKILVFIDWYLPGFKAGGPIRSCVSLVSRLSNKYHFKIITGDTDLKDEQPYKNVNSDAWNILGDGTEVFYCSKSFPTYSNFKSIIHAEKPDIIYLNSMYSPRFTMLPLIVAKWSDMPCKIIVAPRGMLSKGALNLKPLKKQVFLSLSKITGLFKNVTFHASSTIEVGETRAVFGDGTKIFHAMNLTPAKEQKHVRRVKKQNHAKLVYLGRISEVKNLLQCITTLKKAGDKYNFALDVYGPEENQEYLDLCIKEINSLPENVKVQLKGGVDNSKINEILSDYHFLFLLTLNENFGHAIVEGFTAGCPVIISDKTPWRNLAEKNCGWDLPLGDENKIVETLRLAASMSQEQYDQWSEAAYKFADSINENKKAIDDHIQMFES